MAEDWLAIAASLKFESEVEMWEALYTKQKFSILQLSELLGFGTATVRRRLFESGIKLRSRGGPHANNNSRLKLLRMDPRLAVYGSLTEAARLANLDKSTVWHFRMWVNGLGKEMYENRVDSPDVGP